MSNKDEQETLRLQIELAQLNNETLRLQNIQLELENAKSKNKEERNARYRRDKIDCIGLVIGIPSVTKLIKFK